MKPELLQLLSQLQEYRKLINKIKNIYDDPEYLAWMSIPDNISKSDWPKDINHPFNQARRDPEFRNFRIVYKQVSKTLRIFIWGIIPESTRMEYQERFVKEEGGVPF